MSDIISSLGTVVRETSNFLVQEQILASTQSTITFSGLDGLTDGGYILEISGPAASATDSIGLFINGDMTAANYRGGTVSGTAAGNYAGNMQGNYWYSSLSIFITNGYVGWLTQSFDDRTTMAVTENYSARYLVPVSNIATLTIRSTVGTVQLPIGTTARLYRKKQGVPSAFPSVSGMLIADYIVPSDTTQVTFTGLNSILHGGYTMRFGLASGFAGSTLWYLYVNGDTTASHYSYSGYFATLSALSLASGNVIGSLLANVTAAGQNACGVAELFGPNPVNQDFKYKSDYSSCDASWNPQDVAVTGRKMDATISNITRIDIVANQANGIKAGSTIQIFRRK